jgi:CDP-4-dehydro-6-deoxyglucose reductase
MSDYWFNKAKPNELLRLNGPLGTFFLRDSAGIDLIFLATGTGIAPIKMMLRALGECSPSQRPHSITVLWGGRNTQDLYENLDEIHGEFNYIPVLSRRASAWSGASGYIQDVLLDLKPDLRNAAIYACGSVIMTHAAKTSLIEAGLPFERFYSDSFVSSGVS